MVARIARVHGDERGTISILTVTTVIGLMMLIGMVLNVGRHLDDKVQMQNAVDASAYSGGTVLARGMNTLAFTNHLLCDVFALTAFLRESRDRNAESYTDDVLNAWAKIGPIFERSDFAKFQRLGPAITQKVPLERELVRSFGQMWFDTQELVLPVYEYVLQERLIPEFQRAVVQTMPQLAQQTTNEVTKRHGQKQPQRRQLGVLWRPAIVKPVGYPDERDPLQRTLPAIDPTPPSAGAQPDAFPDPHPDRLAGADFYGVPNGRDYVAIARRQRSEWASGFLNDFPYLSAAEPGSWNNDRLRFFATDGKMSQYLNLWRIFTCGQLKKLLGEYPSSNLPHVIRMTTQGPPDLLQMRRSENQYAVNQYLDENFMFVGIVHRQQFAESSPILFKNPFASDPLTFAQVHLFIPQPRLIWSDQIAGGTTTLAAGGGGLGFDANVPAPSNPSTQGQPGNGVWIRENYPTHWDLMNQNWTVQLVPATTENLAALLQSSPAAVAGSSQMPNVRLPNLGGVNSRMIRQINNH